ncbi:MAG: MBL fold metallo-hydrolase [Planctomycetes bacterium]|nr:MBL fold metallo-hydrolase [Planctomycetota bacterium]
MAGNLNVTWIHGAPNCAISTDPPIQIHRFDDDTFILRQSKCSEPGTAAHPGPSYEAPFMYLLIGTTKALLLDTGASQSPAIFPIASTIGKLLHGHANALGQPTVSLLIAHSHSHGDHVAGDDQFLGIANTSIVAPGLATVKAFFGLPRWPYGMTSIDLGNRLLDVMPIPGHEDSHIAVYDRNTKLLLTGDTLYPGLLVVEDWPVYVRSIARLKTFVDANPVSFVLGAHIEMTNQPGKWFGLGSLFQPKEHVLQLEPRHLVELLDALVVIGSHPRTDRHADFIIYPAGQPSPPLHP